MARPTKYKTAYCDRLLKHMADGGSVAQFCAEIGISRSTFYEWTDTQPVFSDTFTRAKVKCEAYWESKLQEAMFTRDANAPLVKFYMVNRFEGWNDRQGIDHTSSDRSMTPVKLEELTDEQLAVIAAGGSLHDVAGS